MLDDKVAWYILWRLLLKVLKGNNHEAHLPTKHAQARQVPRLSCPYVDEGRPCRSGLSSRQGTQAPLRVNGVPRLETIKSNTEISSLFTHGKRLHTPYLTFIVVRNEKQHDQPGRAAFVAGKKLGNAVWRNAAKRRMRALCLELDGPWQGCDVIFLAKSNIVRVSYSKVLAACDDTLKRAGV